MKRIIFLFTIATLCLITACENTPESKNKTTTSETKNTDVKDTPTEKNESTEPASIASDIQFIRDKYAIINNATNYKTVPFEVKCDERSSSKLVRKYNEEGKLAYLELHDCGGHGCVTKYHYYWDGQLIFIFHKNDYTPGSSHIIEEHRTYFKNGKMIRCLEKRAVYYEGQAPMVELLKNAKNEEVECTPDKLTEDLSIIENQSLDEAKAYFCKS